MRLRLPDSLCVVAMTGGATRRSTALSRYYREGRLELRSVAQNYDDGHETSHPKAALDQVCADALNVSGFWAKDALIAADKKMRAAVNGRSANAVLIHSLNIASKLVLGNTNFPDMT